MPPDSDVPHTSAAGLPEHDPAPIDVDAAAQALNHGARGAFLVAGATSPKNNLAPIVRLADFRHLVVRHVTALVLCCAAGVIEPASAAGSAANVDAARITGADRDPANWMTYGRTYSEQRFSPLSRITAENAKQLGLAWYADLDSNRGQEATPPSHDPRVTTILRRSSPERICND
jgi:hypothetical protein